MSWDSNKQEFFKLREGRDEMTVKETLNELNLLNGFKATEWTESFSKALKAIR